MAKFSVEIDVPESETRAIEVGHIKHALNLALHDVGMHSGEKRGTHEIWVPGNKPGEQVYLGSWTYEHSAER